MLGSLAGFFLRRLPRPNRREPFFAGAFSADAAAFGWAVEEIFDGEIFVGVDIFCLISDGISKYSVVTVTALLHHTGNVTAMLWSGP